MADLQSHMVTVGMIAGKIADTVKLSELDSLAVAPHLAAGKGVNLGGIAWMTWSNDDLVIVSLVESNRKKGGTGDGGDFESIVMLPEASLDTNHLTLLVGGGTSDGGPLAPARSNPQG